MTGICRSPCLSAVGLITPTAVMTQRVAGADKAAASKTSINGWQAGTALRDFNACVYRKHRAIVDALLARSDIMSPDWSAVGGTSAAAMDKLDAPTCLGASATSENRSSYLTIKPPAVRAGLAEAAYLDRYSSLPVRPARTAVRQFVASGDRLAMAQAYADVADCVVAADPVGADKLVRTLPQTIGEKDAARAMATTFGPCLPDKSKISFTPGMMRMIAIDGLWQTYVANDAGSKRPAKGSMN